MEQRIIDRFTRYVQYDTESVPGVEAIPSTAKQHVLARELYEELIRIGMQDVSIDEHAYVMATLPATVKYPVPTIGFVAHIDTTPDFTGADVQPKVWRNYDGGELMLNAEQGIRMSPKEFPALASYKGETLITSDGTTLLGADDKAGVTEIMTAMEWLLGHPEVEHGKIRICFTPDEEVGRGADLFDVKKFGAEWAYTMDGGPLGELEFENFNAAYAEVTFIGANVHPGTAKGVMVNSMTRAAEFVGLLPEDEVPEQTEGYEGFFHLLGMSGTVEKSVLKYIIRDHDRDQFEARKALLEHIVGELKVEWGPEAVQLMVKDQYYNMREKVEPVMQIVELAEQAMRDLGIAPDVKPIRGGTDGARLSYMGLPCPNIFAGGHNMHSRYEYVPVSTMVQATEVICRIAELTAQRFGKK